MEDIFDTTLSVGGKEIGYHIVFENEAYNFRPGMSFQNAPVFRLIREHDEWHGEGSFPGNLKEEAVNALEKYLLSQH